MALMIISRKDKKSKQKKQDKFSCFKALMALRLLWITKGFNRILAEAGVTKREQGLSPKELALATMVQPLVGSKSEKETAKRTAHKIRSADALQKQINRFHNDAQNSFENLLPMTAQYLVSTKPSNIMVLDDTPIEKSGKKMKWAGKYYNSAEGYFYLGYELVVLALVWGRSFLPINFIPRRSKIKQRKSKKTRKSQSKLSLALKLISDALARGIKVGYIVFDSWYFALWFVKRLEKLGLHWVTVAKRNRVFIYQGRKVKAECFARMTRCAGCYPMKFIAELPKYGLVAVVVNYRGKKYEVLVTNDLTLSAKAVVRTYKKRWKIEVLFREAKQHYGLEKFHNQNWYAIIAHFALSLLALFLVRFFSIFLKDQNLEIIKQMFKKSFVKIKKELTIPLGKWQIIFSEFINCFNISKELQICLLSV